MDFLFHKVTEAEKREIKKQAKNILDDFSKKLSKVDKKIKESLIEREKNERAEGEGKCNELDREIMFSNAAEKSEDFIIAERKKW